jgi:uncharacterized coiled-coil protein SlyX
MARATASASMGDSRGVRRHGGRRHCRLSICFLRVHLRSMADNGSGLARRRRCRTLVGEGHDEMTRPNLVRTRVAAQESLRCRVLLLVAFGLAGLVVPRAASAQRADDRAQFDARMNVLDRSVADLSIQIERLNARDRELQHQLEKMRTNYDQRLERLEKGAAPKTPPPRRSKP